MNTRTNNLLLGRSNLSNKSLQGPLKHHSCREDWSNNLWCQSHCPNISPLQMSSTLQMQDTTHIVHSKSWWHSSKPWIHRMLYDSCKSQHSEEEKDEYVVSVLFFQDLHPLHPLPFLSQVKLFGSKVVPDFMPLLKMIITFVKSIYFIVQKGVFTHLQTTMAISSPVPVSSQTGRPST